MKPNKIYCYEPWNRGEIFSIFIVNESTRSSKRLFVCGFLNIIDGSELINSRKVRKIKRKLEIKVLKSAAKVPKIYLAYQVEPECVKENVIISLLQVSIIDSHVNEEKLREREMSQENFRARSKSSHCYFWWKKNLLPRCSENIMTQVNIHMRKN